MANVRFQHEGKREKWNEWQERNPKKEKAKKVERERGRIEGEGEREKEAKKGGRIYQSKHILSFK